MMLSAMIEMTPGRMNSPPATRPPSGAMHEPADIGGELLSLGAGQQHAVVEGVQEAALGNPLLLIDNNSVHHRNLYKSRAQSVPLNRL